MYRNLRDFDWICILFLPDIPKQRKKRHQNKNKKMRKNGVTNCNPQEEIALLDFIQEDNRTKKTSPQFNIPKMTIEGATPDPHDILGDGETVSNHKGQVPSSSTKERVRKISRSMSDLNHTSFSMGSPNVESSRHGNVLQPLHRKLKSASSEGDLRKDLLNDQLLKLTRSTSVLSANSSMKSKRNLAGVQSNLNTGKKVAQVCCHCHVLVILIAV